MSKSDLLVMKKLTEDEFHLVDGRFKAVTERTASGYIRCWHVEDLQSGKAAYCNTRTALKNWIKGILDAELRPEQRTAIEAEVKMMLHAHRDCLRNCGIDTTAKTFDARDGYYGEAFGVMRALVALGYGFFGANNGTEPDNMKAWFSRLEQEVLKEEGFGADNRCEFCFQRYGKDSVRRGQPSYGEWKPSSST